MDAAATNYPAPSPDIVDAVDPSLLRGRDGSLRSPDKPPVLVPAQRRIIKAREFGSPVRRSPRLSGLPLPQLPAECHDAQDVIENNDTSDESEGVNVVAIHLSREETPENDALLPDEPSTVLAERIMRAHDNPSPPPRDVAHLAISCVPGKDGIFPLLSVPTLPGPLYPINHSEQLNQPSDSPPGPSHSLRAPTLGGRPETPEFGIISPRGCVSSDSRAPFVTSVPMKSALHGDPTSTDTIPLSPTQRATDDISSLSSQHEPANFVDDTRTDLSSRPVPGQHGQLVTICSSLDSDIFTSSPTQTVDSSSNPAVLTASDDCMRGHLPSSGRRNCRRFSLNPKTPSSPSSDETGKASLAIQTMDLVGQHNDESSLSAVKGEQESKCRATSTTGVDANSYQRLDSLSPRSTDVLAELCLSPKSTSLTGQTILPPDSIPVQLPPATPSRPLLPSVTYSDFAQSTVRRPVIAPTPMRPNNGPRKSNSPTKSTFEVDDIHRTPAQRIPIETVLVRGTSSLQKTVQLSAASDRPQLGCFLTTRTPVFTRPALDDPSRSPAKRIPVTGFVTSPMKGDHVLNSPIRLSHRARSASVEPHPLRPILARSRSVEPCAILSKPDNKGKIKELVFPIVSVPLRSGTKLPFPLVPGQKPNSDLPPSIPEEREGLETGDTKIDVTLGRATQDNAMSQLRQQSANSRIPRIGKKPYARPPPKNGKVMARTTMAMIRAPKAAPFHLTSKNSGIGNSSTEVSSTEPSNDQQLAGSLKRKRGAEATAPSNSHPVLIRQVVPGILSEKYAPKPVRTLSHVQSSSPQKLPQPLRFRKVVDGMLSARYAPAKANLTQMEVLDSASLPLSPLSELSSSSNEELSDEKLLLNAHSLKCPRTGTSGASRTDGDSSAVEPSTREYSPFHQGAGGDEPLIRPRRTSRTRKSTQQQYVLDVFSGNNATRPPPARRKPQPRMEGNGFMGMSATALKALTTSNTTKNQRTVAVLATEVIRKEGLRPESPTVKARTILQKQQDERDVRRKERALRKARMSEGSGPSETGGRIELGDRVSLGTRADHGQDGCVVLPKHRRGPGDEEDYETPERPEHIIESLRLEGIDTKVKPVKQVKWHRGLLTAVYLDEVNPGPKSLPKDVVVRGCLAPTSKNVPLDPLGNLVDIDNRPSPELVTEQIVVKKYLYDNDIEPEPIPMKMTRSKGKKSKS